MEEGISVVGRGMVVVGVDVGVVSAGGTEGLKIIHVKNGIYVSFNVQYV